MELAKTYIRPTPYLRSFYSILLQKQIIKKPLIVYLYLIPYKNYTRRSLKEDQMVLYGREKVKK